MEEHQHHDQLQSTPNTQSIIPPHGEVQYHDLTVPDAQAPLRSNPSSSNTDVIGDIHQEVSHPPAPTGSPQAEQPDLEPMPGSQTPSDLPAPETSPAEPQDAADVPVPDSDDELFSQEEEFSFTVTDQQAWRFEVNVCQHDIELWKKEPNPQELAFWYLPPKGRDPR